MATLKERIQDDMKAAMRAKDSARLGAIRLLLAAIKQKEVDDRVALDDAGVIAVVDRLLKQRRDSIAAFEQAGRDDLAAKERAEAEVLQTYLPQRLDAAAIAAAVQALVQRVASELGRAPTAADMGKVMAAAKAELAGKADMAQVSAAVKAALAG
ncbi:Yqey-like protein [Tepidimonas alkaliphilus]|uniref:Yqey-like protein n=1 Tax=Tepidimonas alkaliphilus TaxID=2588942 RepID=A0A554W661_9BURK|nr:GatB/YqeY domain-containing protein [Tepidimonas alkaliphilus]TSE19059.1 Yqey-like protein [Tepidimonas alkaliphilus]